jgi:23S rRNA pseudouridine1911/1915/1917 synthase
LSEIVELTATGDAAGERIDVYLASVPRLHGGDLYMSRSRIQHLIEAGAIVVDGESVEKSLKLSGGENIKIVLPDPASSEDIPAEDVPIEIVFQDKYIIVVNKPPEMATHPTAQMLTGTMINALKGQGVDLPWTFYPYRPGVVHRLDKRTSGLLVVAKTEECFIKLVEMMKDRLIQRRYRAITIGNLPDMEGRIEGDIGRHPVERKKMAVLKKGGKPATTLFKVLERYPGLDYVQAKLLTGRTHQIRVHFSHLKISVFADKHYGSQSIKSRIFSACDRMGITPEEKRRWGETADTLVDLRAKAKGHLLHAFSLQFNHPITGADLAFTAPLPDYFEEVLSVLRQMGEVSHGT